MKQIFAFEVEYVKTVYYNLEIVVIPTLKENEFLSFGNSGELWRVEIGEYGARYLRGVKTGRALYGSDILEYAARDGVLQADLYSLAPSKNGR